MSEQSNEEIRIRCAELMGFTIKKLTGIWPDAYDITYPDGTKFSQCDFAEIPDYPDDPAAALTLCDRLREMGFCEQHGRDTGSAEWFVYFHKPGRPGFHASDPSLPRAISLAFLAAMTKEETQR